MSEVIVVFLWWLAIQLLGYAVWPLLARWLRWLPDRGYMLAKPIGLLFVAYGVWLLATVGVVQNTTGGILIVLIGVAVLSVWAWRSQPDDQRVNLLSFWREKWALFLAYEIVTRRPVNQKVESVVHTVGFLALFGLLLAVTVFGDLARLLGR